MFKQRVNYIEKLLRSMNNAKKKEREKQRHCCVRLWRLTRRAGQRSLEENPDLEKFSWKNVVNPCLCCYFDFCPLRVFLLAIAAARIIQHLWTYLWHTFRLISFILEAYKTYYLVEKLPAEEKLPTTVHFELWWHCVTMGICIVEICLYTRLFGGALLIFPHMGWRWFYLCWILTLGGITLSALVIWYFNEVYLTESVWTIVSRSFVFYEMWLWYFHSKQIENHGNTYNGRRTINPDKEPEVNPRIFDEQHKLPFEPYHAWDDNSYSVAEQFIIHHHHPHRPRKTYTKSQLKKRMTGLDGIELEAAIENYTTSRTNL